MLSDSGKNLLVSQCQRSFELGTGCQPLTTASFLASTKGRHHVLTPTGAEPDDGPAVGIA
jgi:hypothetical protein